MARRAGRRIDQTKVTVFQLANSLKQQWENQSSRRCINPPLLVWHNPSCPSKPRQVPLSMPRDEWSKQRVEQATAGTSESLKGGRGARKKSSAATLAYVISPSTSSEIYLLIFLLDKFGFSFDKDYSVVCASLHTSVLRCRPRVRPASPALGSKAQTMVGQEQLTV